MSKLTHRQLCEIGAKFLKRPESANGHGCHFTIIEPSCYGKIRCIWCASWYSFAWYWNISTRGENKQIGFLADRSKPHRLNPEMGMGKYRYYICPTGLIKPEELPEKWGLIYVSEKGYAK